MEKRSKQILAAVIVVVLIAAGLATWLLVSGVKYDPETLVYYSSTNVLGLDPHDQYDVSSFIPQQNIYDTLIGYRGEDISTYVPVLATSWSSNPQGDIWTFTLRQGVKFSNGSNFTAEDVAYTFDRIIGMGAPDTGVDWIISQQMSNGSVEIVDNYTVKFHLDFPYAGFLATLGTEMPSAIMDKQYVEANGGVQWKVHNDYIDENPMGTGPYMLDHWTRNTETVLVKNPNYWNATSTEYQNAPEKVIIREVNRASTRIQALKSGAADIADIPLSNIADVSGRDDIVVDDVPTFQAEMIALNLNSSLNHDVMASTAVRQALSWSFDYDTTIETVYAGHAEPLQGPIPNGFPLETESQPFKLYNFSLTKAEQILQDAGFTKTAGQYFDGEALVVYVDSGDTERLNAAVSWRATLNSIGIVLDVRQVPSDTLEEIRYSEERAWDMYMTGWVIDYLDPDDYALPIAASANVGGGDYFNTGWVNTAVDDAIVAAAEEQDPDQRAALYQIVWEEMNADPSFILVCQVHYVAFYRSTVLGFAFNPVTWYNFVWYREAPEP